MAREHYDGKKKSSSNSSAQPKHSPPPPDTNISNKSTSSGFSGAPYGLETPKFSFDEIEQKAIDIATETEKPIITQLFQRLRKSLFGRDK
ncbi:MAG: hypothetical protein US99_C0057G0002 [Candidatus Daviesbacteria bacterium GW2011_GWF2_38_6]|uniref:Uncharacterized protein n=1 Tax=Candidatus Daviesbacteria bacterium GW2011_GWF2_38_6 TaxID=1618432 RepID=A0A0G0KB34_9BACT|nr:MAG: hypothetical protein US99_C0057G0002 [Candidatus Daviesbacteria bacterium GW2011_GWF2_38_6]